MKHVSASKIRQAWVFVFLLGLVFLNFPFLHIFNKDIRVLGIPLLVLYLFCGWLLTLGLSFVFARLLSNVTEETEEETEQDDASRSWP